MPTVRRREEAEHDEAQVRDRRVGDQALHVVLLPGDERAVEDAAEDGDAGERAPRSSHAGPGKHAHAEAHVAVGPELEHAPRPG